MEEKEVEYIMVTPTMYDLLIGKKYSKWSRLKTKVRNVLYYWGITK
jgi:hypothetical protein